MCDELMNGSLPILIPTPNGRDEAGTSRDCFLLNPATQSSLHIKMFRFLGKNPVELFQQREFGAYTFLIFAKIAAALPTRLLSHPLVAFHALVTFQFFINFFIFFVMLNGGRQ